MSRQGRVKKVEELGTLGDIKVPGVFLGKRGTKET